MSPIVVTQIVVQAFSLQVQPVAQPPPAVFERSSKTSAFGGTQPGAAVPHAEGLSALEGAAATDTLAHLLIAAPSLSRNRLNVPRAMLTGWTVLVFAFLYLPIVLVIIYSFNGSPFIVLWKGFSLRWYAAVWHDTELIRTLVNSLIIASVTTLVSCVLGTGAAWLLYRYHFRWAGIIRALVFVPLIVPEIILGVSLLLLFTAAHVELGFTTVTIAHVTFCFPFVMIAVQARLQGLDPSLEEAAMDLGATPMQAFVRVILPFLTPAVVAGGLMAFTLSLDEFIVTYFTYSAAATTLPVNIYGMVKAGPKPTINALSTLLIVATVALVVVAEWARKLASPQMASAAAER